MCGFIVADVLVLWQKTVINLELPAISSCPRHVLPGFIGWILHALEIGMKVPN